MIKIKVVFLVLELYTIWRISISKDISSVGYSTIFCYLCSLNYRIIIEENRCFTLPTNNLSASAPIALQKSKHSAKESKQKKSLNSRLTPLSFVSSDFVKSIKNCSNNRYLIFYTALWAERSLSKQLKGYFRPYQRKNVKRERILLH